jgi:hypothetical protein
MKSLSLFLRAALQQFSALVHGTITALQVKRTAQLVASGSAGTNGVVAIYWT